MIQKEILEKERVKKFNSDPIELQAIKKGDHNALNNFFNRNYKVLYGLARKNYYRCGYDWKFGSNGVVISVDDIFNQIYCDLPLYNLSNFNDLDMYVCGGIKWTARYVDYGGYSKRLQRFYYVSLDKPIAEDLCLADTIGVSFEKSNTIYADEQAVNFDNLVFELAAKLYANNLAKQFAFVNMF